MLVEWLFYVMAQDWEQLVILTVLGPVYALLLILIANWAQNWGRSGSFWVVLAVVASPPIAAMALLWMWRKD